MAQSKKLEKIIEFGIDITKVGISKPTLYLSLTD